MEENRPRRDMGNLIGITVALLSAFMAVTKVKDDNIVQAMMQAKSDAVDTWSEYQAKKIKQHLVEMGRNQTRDMALLSPGIAKDSMETQNRGLPGGYPVIRARRKGVAGESQGLRIPIR